MNAVKWSNESNLLREIVNDNTSYDLSYREQIMKNMMENNLLFHDSPESARNIITLYNDTNSPVVLDFIVYNLITLSHENFFIDVLYRKRNSPIFKSVVQRLDKKTWRQNVKQLDDKQITKMVALRKLALADSVLDTSLGLRQLGLPAHVVENITSQAYDTTGFSLYELMNIVTPVLQNKTSTWMKAGDERTFRDFE